MVITVQFADSLYAPNQNRGVCLGLESLHKCFFLFEYLLKLRQFLKKYAKLGSFAEAEIDKIEGKARP